MKAPIAEERPQRREIHGVVLEDPYAWLRADNWREVMRDPSVLAEDIRAHLEAENAYTEAQMAPTEALQRRLFEEYRGRIKEDDSSVPADEGPWAYYSRYEHGAQHPLFCRRPRDAEGPETVLLDGEAESKGKAYFQVGACENAPGHGRIGVATDETGAELWTLRFREPKDPDGGEWLDDRIEGTSGSFVFLDDDHILYTVLDAEHRPRTVKRHRIGDDPANDPVVYDEPDPGFFVGLGRTESGRFCTIDAHDHTTSEVRLVATDDPERDPVLVATRDKDVEYDVSHHGETLIVRTNADGAEDYELRSMPLAALGRDRGRSSWQPLLPHEEGRLILGYHVFAQHLVVLERVDGLPRLVVFELSLIGEGGVGEGGAAALRLGAEHRVAFDEEAYSLGLHGSREFDTSVVRFGYSSMTTPGQVFDYDMRSRRRVLRKTQEVPSGHDPAHYESLRIMVRGHDGEEIPVSLLHHRDTPLDGSAPCFLYGYGSYGHAIPASFGITRLSLVDRGFVVAIAHVRGGMERGYRWYREGKLDKKTNTFLDFIAAAEGLVERGWVDPGAIVAQGGSAGGMLMGAVANLRPDLFFALVADVPFVDVLNTMLDDTLPLTPPEWPEWGNPIEDPEAFARIRSYSPYDNVEAKAYPHLLVMAGLSDPRVTYWEPAKWVARLRSRKTDDNLLLLKTNMDAGHGGASGRLESLREVAFEQAFLLKVLGREDAPLAPST